MWWSARRAVPDRSAELDALKQERSAAEARLRQQAARWADIQSVTVELRRARTLNRLVWRTR